MPANFTNPKNIQAYFTALAPDARFDSIFAYIMSDFQESVKAVTRDKVSGTTQNYAIYMTTLTVLKEQKLRLSLGTCGKTVKPPLSLGRRLNLQT